MSSAFFLLSFGYYLWGLCGTVPIYRDSGDLIASIHTLGIAHPPGYAFYILIGKLFVTLMPFGNVAYRVNVMSACFGAATTGLLWIILKDMAGGRTPAKILAALPLFVYATSPAVVALSRVAEMYTLAACLAALILWCLVATESPQVELAAFLLGLGLSVHPTLIFLTPLYFALGRRRVGASEKASPALYFLLGLSVFLYLPIRAAQQPLLNWGDPSHWRSFWRVVTRADYGGLKLHPEQSAFAWTVSSAAAQLNYFVMTMKKEWGWAAMFTGLIGVSVSLHDQSTRRMTIGLGLSWSLAGPLFFLLSNLPIQEGSTPAILQPYLLMANLLWAPFVFWGLKAPLSLRRGALIVPAVLGAWLIGSRPFAGVSERNEFYAYDYARNLLRALPPGAVLYEPDDPTHFSIQVLQSLEKRRPDVVLLNFFRTRWGYEQIKRRWPELLPPIPINTGQELQRLLWTYATRQRPFYAELPQKFGAHSYRAEGLVYSAIPEPKVGSDILSRRRGETLLELSVRRGDFVTAHHANFFTRHLIGNYAAADCNLGLAYANANLNSQAVEHYRRALAIDPSLSAAYNNWGLVAFEEKDYKKSVELFRRALLLDPRNERLRTNVQLASEKAGTLDAGNLLGSPR